MYITVIASLYALRANSYFTCHYTNITGVQRLYPAVTITAEINSIILNAVDRI